MGFSPSIIVSYEDISHPARVVSMVEKADEAFDWSAVFSFGCCHLILNLEGYAIVIGKHARINLSPGIAALCRTEEGEKPYAVRHPGAEPHRCVVLSVSREWLRQHFGETISHLHPLLREERVENAAKYITGFQRLLKLQERDLGEQLLNPPVAHALREIWFRGKLIECFSLFAAKPLKPPGQKTDDAGRKVDLATLWLREHFAEDFNLKELSRHVGCAPHYLSRLYRQRTGQTLSGKLRQIRIHAAAEMLLEGELNVTEVAYRVGYNSLSHFSKAFLNEKHMLPSAYRSSRGKLGEG
ncbi:MAG: AraC family transcriptional regulator [Luteolibacter sp.]